MKYNPSGSILYMMPAARSRRSYYSISVGFSDFREQDKLADLIR
jgi:hypothetical protein